MPADVLGAYAVVFDAVYVPLHTRLLRDAEVGGYGGHGKGARQDPWKPTTAAALPQTEALPFKTPRRRLGACLSPGTRCFWDRPRSSSGSLQGRKRMWKSCAEPWKVPDALLHRRLSSIFLSSHYA